MINLKFAGSALNEGKPDNSTSCVTGFDQAAYIIGTSSNLWDVRDFNFCFRLDFCNVPELSFFRVLLLS